MDGSIKNASCRCDECGQLLLVMFPFEDKNEPSNKPMRINYYIIDLWMISKGRALALFVFCHAVTRHVLCKAVSNGFLSIKKRDSCFTCRSLALAQKFVTKKTFSHN